MPQCLRQLYQQYMSGVRRLESNNFYAGWYIYIYIYICYIIYIYFLYIYIYLLLYIYISLLYIHTAYIYIYVYIYIYISSFPGLISVARVNEQRKADATRVLKVPGAELCQIVCGVVNEQKIFSSHQSSIDSSMKKLRAYIHRRVFCPSEDSSEWLELTSREQLMSPECSTC